MYFTGSFVALLTFVHAIVAEFFVPFLVFVVVKLGPFLSAFLSSCLLFSVFPAIPFPSIVVVIHILSSHLPH